MAKKAISDIRTKILLLTVNWSKKLMGKTLGFADKSKNLEFAVKLTVVVMAEYVKEAEIIVMIKVWMGNTGRPIGPQNLGCVDKQQAQEKSCYY